MPYITLTWDHFIIVFFVVVLAYSFIIGKSKTVKLILSGYAAILGAEALGNVINHAAEILNPRLPHMNMVIDPSALIITKISLFVFFMVFLAVKGNFEITMQNRKPAEEFAFTLFFGVLNAIFMITTVLVFISEFTLLLTGKSIFEDNITQMFDQSRLVKIIAVHYHVFLALPVISLIITSFIDNDNS